MINKIISRLLDIPIWILGKLIDLVNGSKVEVVEMSQEEWNDAINRALDKLGLTYDELAQQAKSEILLRSKHTNYGLQ